MTRCALAAGCFPFNSHSASNTLPHHEQTNRLAASRARRRRCRKQVSRGVAQSGAGAGAVTTRGHVHWVVTQHGAANLHGLTLRRRDQARISLAHPDFIFALRREVAALRRFNFI